ncbi:MAG: thioredoxin domain-containing protein [Bacteroidota bacterium]
MKRILSMLLLALSGSFLLQANNPTDQATTVVSKPIHLTKAEFKKRVMDYDKNKEWVYRGDKPAIIDFYADWCGPCRKVAPALEELAKEYAGKVYIYKVNVDQERELAGLFGIRNIPTYLIIPMKGKPELSSGAAASHVENKARFKKVIDDLLK